MSTMEKAYSNADPSSPVVNISSLCALFDDSIQIMPIYEFMDEVYMGWKQSRQMKKTIMLNAAYHSAGSWLAGRNGSSALRVMIQWSNFSKHFDTHGGIHGVIWHLLVKQLALTKATCNRSQGLVPCQLVPVEEFVRFWQFTCETLSPSGVMVACAHGMGHGALMAALSRSRAIPYTACTPFAYGHIEASTGELTASLHACETLPLQRMAVPMSACLKGVYHAYTRYALPAPFLPNDAKQLCGNDAANPILCYAMVMGVGLFYDEGLPPSMAAPHPPFSLCGTPMRAEINLLACVYVSARMHYRASLIEIESSSNCYQDFVFPRASNRTIDACIAGWRGKRIIYPEDLLGAFPMNHNSR